MKRTGYIWLLLLTLFSKPIYAQEETMTRAQLATQTYEQLFKNPRTASPTDPEFMEILQRNIFGEVFFTGSLIPKQRELITVAALTTLQTLPQLKSHIGAALNAGNTPLQIREAIYQCAPFIGFPRTLNAIAVFNETVRERNIPLPLENTGTTTDETRHEKGLEIQKALYGEEVKTAMASLPGEYKDVIPATLTDFCFGDFYLRYRFRRSNLHRLLLHESRGQHKECKQKHSHVTHRRHVDECTFTFYFYSWHNLYVYRLKCLFVCRSVSLNY